MVSCVSTALHSYLNYLEKYFTLITCVHMYVCLRTVSDACEA